jgi:carbon monoxide dehydrogenase subunit G
MQVDLEKQFPLDAAPAAAWSLLRDVPAVAACMPGAQVTEQLDASHFKGSVRSKIGPATMSFAGTVEVLGLDEASHELQLLAKGQDTKGTSSAQMDLTARIVPADGGGSTLQGTAKVTVNGKVASLGGRMMTQVADQILNQFGSNFAADAAARSAPAAGEAAAAAPAPLTPETGPADAAPKHELNGIAFAWSVLAGFVKSLFQKKPASHHG